ncbi:MAG: hypothetical protein NTW67_04305, partial [Candidatus Woesearchaeota archaeon]|nr:hypothetical protein [Candidatus Woesearchaeota archaeon]
LVVAVAGEEELRHYYEAIAGDLGISCRAFPHAEEVPADLRDARMLISNWRSIPYVGGFSGSKILITGGDVIGGYENYCVNEVWQNPVSVGVLQGLMRKCTSDKPRLLCIEDDTNLAFLVESLVGDMGVEPVMAKHVDAGLPLLPSVHAVLSDVYQEKFTNKDGYWMLAEARKIYDGRQLPFALMSGKIFDEEKKGDALLLPKIFSEKQLVATVRSLISKSLYASVFPKFL